MVRKQNAKYKRPTMNDVAKLAGVSQPTVSRVLNSDNVSAHISDETKQRVMEAVKELGYRTNVLARSLRTQRSQLIAMMIADISNGFYHIMVRAVQDVAREHNYEVLISNSDHVYENERHFCEVVMDRGVDGVIMVPIHLTNEELDQYVTQTHIPFVALGQHVDHPDIDKIYVRDDRAIYEATQWLIKECGHREIGFIGVPDFHPPGPRRFQGFMQAMDEAGLPFDHDWWYPDGDFTREGGGKAVEALHRTGKMPTALVVLNDLMAIGAILTLQELGYKVPNDVAVVGFDDIPEATIVRPTLTTIAQDPRDIGLKLGKALFRRINNPKIAQPTVQESTYRLVERGTTRRVKQFAE